MIIEFEDILDGYEYSNVDPYLGSYAWIDLKTGRVHFHSDSNPDADDFNDEFGDMEHYDEENVLAIPNRYDLDLGKELVFDFMSEKMPQDYNRVQDIFSYRGAYARFKDFLHERGMLQEWYNYEDEQTRAALRRWCEDNNLEISETRKKGDPPNF